MPSTADLSPDQKWVVFVKPRHALIVAIALEDPVSSSLRVIFCGTGAFGLPALDALLTSPHQVTLIVTQPDRPAGRHRELKGSPIKERALKAGIPVFQPEHLSRPEAVDRLRSEAADVMVVVSYGQILRAGVLALPRLGCVNLHGSLLPRHRGASPVQAAILAGDEESGTTSMIMDAGLDTGPILMEAKVRIGSRESAPELHDRLAAAGGRIIVPTLDGLASGNLSPRAQGADGVTVCRTLTKESGRIDWRKSATEIDRLVRAMVPWPSALSTLVQDDGEKIGLQVHDAMVVPAAGDLTPGSLRFENGHFEVACGSGYLRLLRLKPDGKNLMDATAFLRGRRLTSNDRMAVEGNS